MEPGQYAYRTLKRNGTWAMCLSNLKEEWNLGGLFLLSLKHEQNLGSVCLLNHKEEWNLCLLTLKEEWNLSDVPIEA